MIGKIEGLLSRWELELENSNNKKENLKKIKELKKILSIKDEIVTYEDQMNSCIDEPELKEIFLKEIQNLEMKMQFQMSVLKESLLSKNNDIIMEIRSGEGGQEAELFALDLFEMYKKLCKKKHWDFKIFELSLKDSGGIKNCTIEIKGKGVNLWLLQESGVHCVKRVPITEKKGRTHTSTATVAILKQPNEIEVIINEKDLKIEVFRSSGPGGQSVNTTDSAVRITHIPTGIVASQQDEKSQIKNKEKAMKILKARIYEKKLEEETKKNIDIRREAIGKAKRNERIRTYHFTQNWVNDSRINLKSFSISKFMEADDLIYFLDELIFNVL